MKKINFYMKGNEERPLFQGPLLGRKTPTAFTYISICNPPVEAVSSSSDLLLLL